jgi:hypothetical protein
MFVWGKKQQLDKLREQKKRENNKIFYFWSNNNTTFDRKLQFFFVFRRTAGGCGPGTNPLLKLTVVIYRPTIMQRSMKSQRTFTRPRRPVK